jgi:enoyl-CoA hydratase/carnithine racemase
MYGPIRLIRSDRISEYRNLGPIYEWADAQAYLIIDRVSFREHVGAILCYHNPPVHQVGTPGLHGYLDGLDAVLDNTDDLEFLILYDANDPVHSGGDLKESLARLEESLELKRKKEITGASEEETAKLFDWGRSRLRKGVILHGKIRRIARSLRVVGICGGGARFGGSAEIPLMSDYLIGDSRGGMCFSEAMIGIIPGWAGIARVLIKAGLMNAAYMTKTAREVTAFDLKEIGVYNEIADIPFALPKRTKTGTPHENEKRYLDDLEGHNDKTGLILLPKGLELATCPLEEIPVVAESGKKILATRDEIILEVERRLNPDSYSRLWGKPLKAIKEDIAKIGRPLAPQSIRALDTLFEGYDASSFDENAFVKKELEADAALYRDPRFLEGLTAMLEQRVPNFKSPTNE